MIHAPFWLSAAMTYDLGWTLIHFLWQGLVLAAILQAILPMCRDAGARHNWALAMLAAMVLAPLVTFFVIHGHAGAPLAAGAGGVHGDVIVLQTPIAFGWINFLVALWLVGVLLLSLRTLGGWYLVEMMWRRDGFALPEDLLRRCQALKARLGISRSIVFLQSALVNAPVVIGWLRPIILIPVSAVCGLTPRQLDALIMHELAHIRRFDNFTNILLVMAETLLFYHPAVWWVGRRIRAEREHCCDDFAVAMCGDAAAYVEALTSLEIAKAMPVLVLAANGGKLKRRVARLLDVPTKSRKISPFAVMGLLFLCAVAATAATARSGDAPAKAKPATLVMHSRTLARITPQTAITYENSAEAGTVQTDAGYRRPDAPRPRTNVPAETTPVSAIMPVVAPMIDDAPSQNEAPVQAAPAEVANLVQQTDSNSPIERIVVTARRWLGSSPQAAIRNFVDSYTIAATPTVGELARWKFAVCARTYGLSKPEYDDFVTKRVEDIAAGAGMQVRSAPCHYSVEIIFTAKPQEFLDKVHQIGARLLGPKPAQAATNASMRYPIQAWYATGTRDIDGQLRLDDEDNAGFGAASNPASAFTLPPGFTGLSFYRVEGRHWSTGMSSELQHVYVIADTSKTEGFELGAVADYVAVMVLSQTQNFDVCKPMPSITNLIAPSCDADLKPGAITDSDLAYLKAVYTMDPGANLQQQKNFIADRIAMMLGVK